MIAQQRFFCTTTGSPSSSIVLTCIIILCLQCCYCTGQFLDDASCTRIVNNLNLQAAVTCKCTTSSRPFGGIDIFVECVNPDDGANFCFGSQFCGSASFNFTRAFPGGTRTGSICMSNVTLDPDQPVYLFPDFCINAYDGSFGKFRRCTVDVEGQTCSCTVCRGGRAFTIDCVAGPYLECFGLNPYPPRHKKTAAPWTLYPVQSPPSFFSGGVPSPIVFIVPTTTTPAPIVPTTPAPIVPTTPAPIVPVTPAPV